MDLDTIYLADCFAGIASVPDCSIDLIITSPPYGGQRIDSYGGVDPDHYVEWFLPLGKQLYRVLKPTGSLVLNIKENVVDGERHTYVLELILALKHQGWRWTEDYVWHKKNCMPGKWRDRLRDAWEHCLHFTKTAGFAIYQDAVKVPPSDATVARGLSLSAADRRRQASAAGSGFGATMANCVGRNLVLPSNVLHLAAQTKNVGHSAAFPLALPEFFVQLLSQPGDVVLDPFVGSGTTCLAARLAGRRWLGFEAMASYYALAIARLATPHHQAAAIEDTTVNDADDDDFFIRRGS